MIYRRTQAYLRYIALLQKIVDLAQANHSRAARRIDRASRAYWAVARTHAIIRTVPVRIVCRNGGVS
jgi:hypothetical protein